MATTIEQHIDVRQSRIKTLKIALAATVVVILAAVGGYYLWKELNDFGERIPDLGTGLHIEKETDAHPPYNSNPPTSGHHVGRKVAPVGIHTEPIPDEITVHNLEHGAVIIHYRQDIDKGMLDQLTNLTRELQQQSPCVLLIPRPTDKLDTPIAMTAWARLYKLQTVDAEIIRKFFNSHVDQGPEDVCVPQFRN